MPDVQWARAGQFNWSFDNLGGTPLQEAVAGNWSGATAQVEAGGRVTIQAPHPGGGQVYFVRGVWRQETMFPWDGFWADPMDGDLVNYYSGGSLVNQGAQTVLTLGTSLPAGAAVQVYYIYVTGEQAARYEPLNNYPCIRRAYRGGDDYSYDFAVDRLLDLMVCLHLAGQEQGRDYRAMRQFLWDALQPRQESRTSPLIYDSFERQRWDRGAYLMYRSSTLGVDAFQVFQTEPVAGDASRALHVRLDLPTTQDSAWCGYGLGWSLAAAPFSQVDRVSLKVLGQAVGRWLHNLTKSGSGSASLVLLGDYTPQEKRRFVVLSETTGEVGQATFRWSRDGGQTWEATGVVTGDSQHPASLWGGVQVYWEGGTGDDLVAGDYWTFWGGEPVEHPRRLLVVLNDSAPGTADPWGPSHTFVHALPDRFSEWTALELPFSQFWRRDNLIDDGDRVRAMWGSWYAGGQPYAGDITIADREETEVLLGETFYTQRQITWNLSPQVAAFGVWAGIDTARCNSSGHTNLNFLLKPVVSGGNTLTIRVKVKDARGSYFYKDVTVTVNAWQRVTVNLGEMLLEWGSAPLTHPLQVVDVGIPSAPPSNGAFFITDLKFDGHLTFTGSKNLRLLEFKIEQQGLQEHEWWLDEVGLNLEAGDAYPYAPRLAISLGPYGPNAWRGPTLVHYAHPLGPYLMGALNLSQNYLNLHRDAQNELYSRYGGVKGPILPVHTRNDIENIALCGEENFGKFCWWPRYRDYGKVVASFNFNESLIDATGNHPLTWTPGNPTYTAGLCQPGNSALYFDGTGGTAYCNNHADFKLGNGDFTLEAMVKFTEIGMSWQTIMSCYDSVGNNRSWILYYSNNNLVLYYSTNGISYISINGSGNKITAAGVWYHLACVRSGGMIYFYVNGAAAGSGSIGTATLYNHNAPFRLGRYNVNSSYLKGHLDLARVYKGRGLSQSEIQDRWKIIQGQLNGSAYPEAGHALGQYWAFYRLAQYFFVSNDPAAWEILNNWLTWLNTYGAAEGSGWKLPVWFSEYGFVYGSYDAGAAASVALGCLYIYLRNGNATAQTWARRILDDLRLNRQSGEFGGAVYKSDYHYAWLNALVAQAFGLAVNGLSGQAYAFPATGDDATHFEAMLGRFFALSGDTKPNLLNSDLIPFTYTEVQDVWDYAPHYVFTRRMGSLEGVVLMLGAALEYAKAKGDWTWFHRLLRFILRDQLAVLSPSQIRSLTAAYDLAGLKNLVRVRYGDYDRDNSKYAEARDNTAIAAWGEQAVDLDCRYGRPVVLENPETASLLASRLLARLAAPVEEAEVTTWLEGVRLEVMDTLAVSSDFHGLEQAEFTVFGKAVDLKKRQVRLSLARPLECAWTWAVDAGGGDYDAYAIDQSSPYDGNWSYRAYVS